MGSWGPHLASPVTNRGKSLPRSQAVLGPISSRIWWLTWGCGLAMASDAVMPLSDEGKDIPHHGNTEAQTDLHREDCHGSRRGGAGGDADQGTAKEEGAVPGVTSHVH